MKFSEHGIGRNNDILEILINQSLSDKTKQIFNISGGWTEQSHPKLMSV